MKRWYVVQVYPGYEDRVKKDLLNRMQEKGTFLLDQVLVPSVKFKSFFAEESDLQDERLFPGYILVEMECNSDTINFVLATHRVVKFLGGLTPAPLSKKEVDRIVSQVQGGVVVSASKKSEFVVGGEIDIAEGAFAGFVGIVDKIDEASERLTVMVSIFGRLTPVELTFDQIKK